ARRRDATDGVWRALRNIGRPIDGIDCDIELGGSWHPRPKLFAFKDARCFVFHSLTDDDFAADVHKFEHAAHGVAGRRVCRFLVTAPEPAQRVQRRGFSRAHEIELNDSLDVLIILFRQSQSHGALIFTQVAHDDKKSTTAESLPFWWSIEPRETAFENDWN